MVILLIIFTFAICLLIDWLLHRRDVREAPSVRPQPAATLRRELTAPIYVGGFGVQEEMAYHPGHTWAAPEGPELVRVGVDDFAQKLVGEIRAVDLPSVGDRVVQGQQAWTLRGKGRKAPLLSPVSGRVVDVNPLIQDRPEVIRSDPYEKGWLMVIRTSALRVNLNNLLMGDLVRRWMEDTCARLRSWSAGGLSVSFADGGTAIDDLSAGLADTEWEDLVREFLLTDPEP